MRDWAAFHLRFQSSTKTLAVLVLVLCTLTWFAPRCLAYRQNSYLRRPSSNAVLDFERKSFRSRFGRFRIPAQSSHSEISLRNQFPSSSTEEIYRSKPKKCEWCFGKEDGLYADEFADPPNSVYFRCLGEQLQSLHACPEAKCFSDRLEQCCDCPSALQQELDVTERTQLSPEPFRHLQPQELESDSVYSGSRNGNAGVTERPFLLGLLRTLSSHLLGLATVTEKGGAVSEGKAVLVEGKRGQDSNLEPLKRRSLSEGNSLRVKAVFSSSPSYEDFTELNALLEFKNNVIDYLNSLKTWVVKRGLRSVVKGSNPRSHQICSWRGVACGSDGKLRNLTLSGLYLKGKLQSPQSIPASFGNLTELFFLDLSDNIDFTTSTGLTGPIPVELAQCTNLVEIHLGGNKFSGDIPDLSALKRLVVLDLSTNDLTGPVPKWLGKINGLQYISLASNHLTGQIPTEIGDLKDQLIELYLGANNLTGSIPASFARLLMLFVMELNENQLSGPLPRWLPKLQYLMKIDLNDNQFTGSIPLSWSTMGSLTDVLISNNQLSGRLPFNIIITMCDAGVRLGGQAVLSNIDLSYNNFSGTLPDSLGQCSSLTNLILDHNEIEGPIPKSFITAFSALATPSLYVLGLGYNKLNGSVPDEILQVTSLSSISLSGNRLHGRIPAFDCSYMGMLRDLTLADNFFEGPVPKSMASCLGNFVTLDLANNNFNGTPSFISGFQMLTTLNLSHNSFSGALPVPTLSADLAILDLSSNSFSGPIPNAFYNTSSLAYLNISRNSLNGTIPDSFSYMGGSEHALSVLDVSHNQLTGEIPGIIQKCAALVYLDLSYNHFYGQVPGFLFNFAYILSLDLGNNQLSSLPQNLTTYMLTLANLNLRNNQISGPIPLNFTPAFPRLKMLKNMDLSSNQFNGTIPYGFLAIPLNSSFNASYNNLSGLLPPGNFSLLPASSLVGNPFLCGGFGYKACPVPKSPGLSTGALVGIIAGAVAVAVFVVVAGVWLSFEKDEWAGGKIIVFQTLPFRLTIHHILDVTNRFGEDNILGRGGFGSVYKGTMLDGTVIAVKRLASQSEQGEREVQAEMETLGNVHHRHLCTLIAAYIGHQNKECLLIYKFLPGGSLDNILDKEMEKGSVYRTWKWRRSISHEIALGLKYLHHDCKPRIIHRDLKPANILLDEDNVAYVTDFGLARELGDNKSHRTTAVFGTVGYLSPEYTLQGRMSFKSDVFAYGVMLLQIISGKLPSDEDVAERGLSRWCKSSSIYKIIDARIDDAENFLGEMIAAVKIGILCTSRLAADRPTMEEVVYMFENLEEFASGIDINAAAKGKWEEKGEVLDLRKILLF